MHSMVGRIQQRIIRWAGAAVMALLPFLLVACQAQGAAGRTESHSPRRHVSQEALTRADSYERGLEGKAARVSAEDAKLHEVAKPDPKAKRYTLMVYMIGSNLESHHAAATDDLREMLDSGIDFVQTNIVVYAGGSERWNSKIPAGRNSVLDLSRPVDDWVVAQTQGDVSMGAPQTLAEFANYCAEHYPAKHNALILWDHGGGPLWGYGHDELHNGDGLLLGELREAMEATSYRKGSDHRLDWVGFDACLMGSIENANLWKDYAGHLVVSEETEPGNGWDYSFLSALNETEDSARIGEAIVTAYASFYEQSASSFSNPDVTIACYDLARVDAVVSALDDLLQDLSAMLGDGGYADLSRARRASKAFGVAASGGRASGYDLVDICDFADQFHGAYPGKVEAVRQTIDELVISQAQNVEKASGVSLYVPGDNRELYEVYCQLGERDAHMRNAHTAGGGDGGLVSELSGAYDAFVAAMADEWLAVSEVDWTLPEPAVGADGVSLQLTDEQREALASATYTVLGSKDSGMYDVLTADVELAVDQRGALRVPADPPIIQMKTDIGKARPGLFRQIEDSATTSTFSNTTMQLLAAGDYADAATSASDERFSIVVQVDKATGKVAVSSVLASDDAVGVGGKGTVDVSRYSHVRIPVYAAFPTYDAEGHVLSWDEWDLKGSSGYQSPLEGEFGFELGLASELPERSACQIVLTDVNGERHALPPVPLPTQQDGDEAQTVTQKTDLGELTFTRVDDHLELTKYEGEDWTVAIPWEVEGLPVTAIGNEAFIGCRYLDEMVVPEGIKAIGYGAFRRTGVYTISLPASLAHVSPAAFAEMPYLESFTVADGSTAMKAIDGVLFTADKKTLVAYPTAKGERYRVPDGVTTIGYGAFATTAIKEVELPNSVITIDRAAFYDCVGLNSLALPKDLQSIGALAFGGNSSKDKGRAPIERVRIGPNVSYIGPMAFDGLALQSIDVDSANTHYSGRGGALLNAEGDTLLEMPRGSNDNTVYVVPDGVVALDPYIFSNYPIDGLDFVLPESLSRFEPDCFPISYIDTIEDLGYRCTIHATKESFAHRFAEEYDMPYDDNVDVASLRHGVTTEPVDDYLLTFWVYGDHAVLKGVEKDPGVEFGFEERTLAIPSEVEGVPVAEMDVQKSSISSIETLVLPKTLASVGTMGLRDFSALTSVRVEEGNPALKVLDGALLSADGETLLSYPSKGNERVVVPEGVERIASNAFWGSSVTGVTLPMGLQEIGDSAFYSCESLETVRFGRGLEKIGRYAFSSCKKLVLDGNLPRDLVEVGDGAFSGIASCGTLSLPDGLERIGDIAFRRKVEEDSEDGQTDTQLGEAAIGPYVEEVGEGAFAGQQFTGFSVDEQNEHYRANGPLLLTGDGLRLVACADGHAGEVRVPDGVRTVDFEVFQNALRVMDIYVPSSVGVIEWPMNLESYPHLQEVTVHVQKGSYGERYVLERGLPWVVE